MRHGRDAGERRHLRRLAEPLVVGEEERPVAQDRPTEHEAELVAIELRLATARMEESLGVQPGVAVELPAGAAEAVGAAAHRRVDDRAAGAPVFGAEVVGLHLELLDRIGRHLHDLVREALVAGAVGVVVDAVENEAVDRAAQAVDVERRVARLGNRGLADARAEQRQIGVVPAIERQVDDLFLGDDLAAIARIGFEELRGADDLDRLADVPDRHREVDTLARVDRDRDVLGFRGREPLELGAHAVGADPDVEKLVAAGRVGDGVGGDPGRRVLERHRDARHDRAG